MDLLRDSSGNPRTSLSVAPHFHCLGNNAGWLLTTTNYPSYPHLRSKHSKHGVFYQQTAALLAL